MIVKIGRYDNTNRGVRFTLEAENSAEVALLGAMATNTAKMGLGVSFPGSTVASDGNRPSLDFIVKVS